MAISFTCSCGRELSARAEHAGQEGRCPACGATVPIPTLTDAAAPIPAGGGTQIAAEVLPQARPAKATGVDDQAVSAQPLAGHGTAAEPEADLTVPIYKLFPPRAVVWATFFSNFFGGTVLLALNYRRLGNRTAARTTFLTGAALLVCYLIALTRLPDSLTGLVLLANLAMLWAMYILARMLQGRSLAAHERRRGRLASGWAAVGIGLLCSFLSVGLLGVIAAAGTWLSTPAFDPAKRVVFGPQEEVYYRDGVTELQARRVGAALQRTGYFDGVGAKTVEVRKEGGRFVVALVLRDGAWDKPEVVRECATIGGVIARDALDGGPLAIELCDGTLRARKTIRPDDPG